MEDLTTLSPAAGTLGQSDRLTFVGSADYLPKGLTSGSPNSSVLGEAVGAADILRWRIALAMRQVQLWVTARN